MDKQRRFRVALFFIASCVAAVFTPNAALAQEIMFCGSTSRAGAALYGAAGPYTEVSGCIPNPATQTLLVTRNGTVAGNGAAWLAFLNGGGAIITEWGNSHTVYNEIYNTAYAQGAWYGDCYDNPAPQVKLNTGHPFWQANDIDETPVGAASCGYDMSALTSGESEVTELGESLSGAIMFAIRPQGNGVLFLLDVDWQDTNAVFTEDQTLFMAALIEGGEYAPPPPGEAQAIPVMSTWGIALMSGLLALLGMGRFRRRSA